MRNKERESVGSVGEQGKKQFAINHQPSTINHQQFIHRLLELAIALLVGDRLE
jgi:hypothetical protein